MLAINMPVYVEIPLTILVLAAVAFLFGALLAVAAKKFAVKKDPRIEQICEHLAGANCGGCGYSGCAAYATAIVEGGAPTDLCPVTGEEGVNQICAIMGVEAKQPVRMRAQVKCAGTWESANFKYLYKGLADCHSVARLGNGPKECRYGCIGLGSCVHACPFDAIHLYGGVATVAYDKCRACGMCVSACPQNLIELVPFNSRYWVSCGSKDKGAVVRSLCKDGCIGCGLCAKVCPTGAITMVDNIAHIDYSRCSSCGACAKKCPRKIIFDGNPLDELIEKNGEDILSSEEKEREA